MKDFRDLQGRLIRVGRELGRGGEGSVFDLDHDPASVAKVYHVPADPVKARKLQAMASLANDRLLRIAAWPTNLLVNNGQVVGLVMPKVSNRKELHRLSHPHDRQRAFPTATWAFLVHAAMNIAAAVDVIHSQGHVIGDLNESGLMVGGDGTVILIDCDSFQIENNGQRYRCTVGKADYTPPELQGRRFADVDRCKQHDYFGLAVLIFQLLFLGRHPFAGRFRGTGEPPTIERAIEEGRFAYSSRAAAFQMEPPPNSLRLATAAPAAELFERAFTGSPAARPSAADWRGVLASIRSRLSNCQVDRAHVYLNTLGGCPWCDIETRHGVSFFASPASSLSFDQGFDLVAFFSRVASVTIPSDNLQTPRKKGVPIPVEADFSMLGDPLPEPLPPTLQQEGQPYIPAFRYEDPPPPDLEQIPSAPVLNLFPVQPEPKLRINLIPAAAVKRLHPRPDRKEFVERRLAPLYQTNDYKVSKWGLITSTAALVTGTVLALIPLLAVVGVAIIMLAMVLGFAFYISLATFLVEIKRVRRVEQARARQWAQRVLQHNKVLQERNIREVRSYEAATVRAASDWQKAHLAWQSRRVKIAAENARRTAEHMVALEAAARSRLEIEARNADRQHRWDESRPERHAAALREWRQSVQHLESVREAVAERNEERRNRHQVAYAEYEVRLQRVRDHNAQIHQRRHHYKVERSRRLAVAAAARKEHDRVSANWQQVTAHLKAAVVQCRAVAAGLGEQYETLRATFETEKARTGGSMRQHQLNAYLDNVLIRDATISNISDGRKATLRAYGIESAWDIDVRDISQIPGFGPALTNNLLVWRSRVESKFVFNPAQAVDPHQLRSLLSRFEPTRRAIVQRLLDCEEALHRLIREHREEADRFREVRLASLECLAQADADVRIMPEV